MRVVEGVRGRFRADGLIVRFDWIHRAVGAPRRRRVARIGRTDAVSLWSCTGAARTSDPTTFTVRRENRGVPPHVASVPEGAGRQYADAGARETRARWEQWSDRCTADGEWRNEC
jgi:hypothetical protein